MVQFHSFGWIPDIPDVRDHYFRVSRELAEELPSSVDLRGLMPPIQDQGMLGSCTAHAVAAAHQYQQGVEDQDCFEPSRLFLYYNARVLEGTVTWDSGATIRNAIKAVARWGTCSEDSWVYDIRRFKTRAPKRDYTEALNHQAISYQRLPRGMDSFRSCLAQNRPFVFGFTVYSSFESDDVASTGVVPLPPIDQYDHVLGGHAVLAVGYDDSEERFIVRNSWGEQWGNAGYFYMPYKYLLNDNLSDDFWCIAIVE